MTTFNDSHLAYLLSLGFELELCKQALTENTTLEDATEWLLNPSRPPVKKLVLELPKVQSDIDLSKPIASSSILTGPINKPIDTEKEQKEKLLQQQQFQKIQQNLKKEKQLEREARKRALLKIQEDKDERKQKTHPTSLPTTTSSSPQQQQQQQESMEEKGAYIQFKFTNSSSLRERFPSNTSVQELLNFVYNKELAWNPTVIKENISLINVFPRRVYTHQDGSLDMKAAGFLPNVSLNVNIAAPVVEQNAQMDTANEREQENDITMDEVEGDNDIEMNIAEQADRQEQLDQVRSAWGRPRTEHHTSNPTAIIEDNEESNTNDEASARRNAVLQALEQRGQSASVQPTSEQPVALERHTTSLHDICSKSVAVLLTQHTTKANDYLKQLSNISPDVAESLLRHLIKNRKLNVSTLRKLTNHCYVQNVILDSYSYCTDSLIEDLAKSNSSISITKLSLRGCDVITDNGIRSLAGLKNLSYLDLNNCKLTDKGLKLLENLSYLNYLNLSKTKISDIGIASLVSNAKFKDQLEVLLLDGCNRIESPRTLTSIINVFSQLIQLSLASVPIKSQDVEALRKPILLEQLDLSNTLITDDDIIKIISQFHQLVDLKLGHCSELTTRGLSFLPRELKQLKFIQFPNREHELDGVLSRFKDLPLEHLDLKGFLNITDEGAGHIAHMKNLRYLNLDGTKITDDGLILCKDLIELEKLYLDRTSITDEGLIELTGLSKLDTLSLCHTQVSNAALKILGDFERTSFTRNLRTLNLAQCTLVTNKGVRYLSGMFNLTNLNLDHTGVSKDCLKYLKDLKYLKLIRLQGIEDEGEQDGEEDDED